jgi:predicted methyltransferase
MDELSHPLTHAYHHRSQIQSPRLIPRINLAILRLIIVEHRMSTRRDAASIAGLSLHDPTNFDIQYSQTLHRIDLLEHWKIPTASRVLELGCGQGDCTTVLAHAVGEQGLVVAVDPAELNYGASFRFDHC